MPLPQATKPDIHVNCDLYTDASAVPLGCDARKGWIKKMLVTHAAAEDLEWS